MNFTIGLFFVTLILLWVIVGLLSMERKKQKMEFEALKSNMQRDGVLFSERAKLAGFTLKKADQLKAQVQKEQQHIKATNHFLNQAIKEKVNKKKIRGKRRRKTA